MYKGAFFFVAPAVYTNRSVFASALHFLRFIRAENSLLQFEIRYDSDVGY
jgi:hypothetical protein